MVRNYLGEVVAALSENLRLSLSPLFVVALETIAARRVVQELDLHSLVFEGDSEISISNIRDHVSPICL